MENLTRRKFVAAVVAGLGVAASTACAKTDGGGNVPQALPPAEPNPADMFGADVHLNMDTIESFIESGALDGAVCVDRRMIDDPARYEAIGGDSLLSMMLEGFTVIPYPYIGSLQELPVDGAYSGPCLYSVTWDVSGEVVSATPNYVQAPALLADLFPKDRPILLMCGGGGYASMMRKLLIHLGWAPERIYSLGGMWYYTGNHPVQIISFADPARPEYYLWRAKMPVIDFGTLR